MADYLRIPVLEGVPQHRTEYATVRADLRRHDADVNSSEPYYPGLSTAVAVALQVQINGTPFQVNTFASNSYTAAITAINAVLGSAGTAFDSDGCLSIRSSVRGSTGSVRIVGGTAAAILGFDVSINKYYATGGEVPSSAEGRVGQPFGAVFPNGKEDLTTEAVRRSLAKISTNTDILYSNQKKPVATLKNIGQISVASNYTGSGPYALPAGAPKIYSKSGKAHLYVVLVDSVLQKPLSIKVTGLLNNGNAADGVNQVTRASQQITGIYNGRIVKVANTSGVSVGDYATIAGATNLTPWNNNGAKWVVEEVIDSTTVSLRPMSKSEAAIYGHEPGTSLNSKKSGAEVYGSITFTSGQFCTATHLTTSMALLPGSVLDVYATVRADVDSSVADVSHLSIATDALNRPNLIGAYGLPFNCVLSQPTGSVASSTLTYGDFYVSWEGVIQRIPSGSVAISSTYNGSAVCASWSPLTGKVVIGTSFLGLMGNLPLMYIPSSRTGIVGTARIGAAYNNPVITVGTFPSRQMSSLEAALYVKKYDTSAVSRIEIYTSQTLTSLWSTPDTDNLEIVGYGPVVPTISRSGGVAFIPGVAPFRLVNVNSSTAYVSDLVMAGLGTSLINVGVQGSGLRTTISFSTLGISSNATQVNFNVDVAQALNIGLNATGVTVGQANTNVSIPGHAVIGQTATVGSDLDVGGDIVTETGNHKIQTGRTGQTSGPYVAGAALAIDTSGTSIGKLVLAKSGDATEAELTKDDLAVLTGGASVLADATHTHQNFPQGIVVPTTKSIFVGDLGATSSFASISEDVARGGTVVLGKSNTPAHDQVGLYYSLLRTLVNGDTIFNNAVDKGTPLNADSLHIHAAGAVPTNTAAFNDKLSSADNTVQKALDTLDGHIHDSSEVTSAGFTDISSGSVYSQLQALKAYSDKAATRAAARSAIKKATVRSLVASGASRLFQMLEGDVGTNELLFVGDLNNDPLYYLNWATTGFTNTTLTRLTGDTGTYPVFVNGVSRYDSSNLLIAGDDKLYKRVGTVWSQIYDSTGTDIRDVATDYPTVAPGQKMVAVGDTASTTTDLLLASSDMGTTVVVPTTSGGTSLPNPTNLIWNSVVYDKDNDWFVAVGYDSTDNAAWAARIWLDTGTWYVTRSKLGTSGGLGSVGYSGGVLVAMGGSISTKAYGFRSTDGGLNWSAITVPPATNLDVDGADSLLKNAYKVGGITDEGYFVTPPGYNSVDNSGAFSVSVDGGLTWEIAIPEWTVPFVAALSWQRPVYIRRLRRWFSVAGNGLYYMYSDPF